MAAVAVIDPPHAPAQDRRPTPGPPTNGPKRGHASAAAVPLLVLCDGVAGAGASELGWLLGRFARRALDGHVILLAGATRARRDGRSVSVALTSRRIADGLPAPGPLYRVVARDRDGRELRVIDGAEDAGAVTPVGLSALLALARVPGAHALVIVAGAAGAPSVLAAAASQWAWVLPADPACIGTVRAALTRAPSGAWRELLVSCHAVEAAPGALRALRALAIERQAPLVLLPALGGSDRQPAASLRDAQVGLQALCGLVTR